MRRSFDLPAPHCAPHAGGDGASGASTRLARKAALFVSEETGIRFEPLVLFAEPLFELYAVDPADAFELKFAPEAAEEAVIAILEAARLFWAFLSLSEPERRERQADLAGFLLGPDHASEEEEDFDLLYDRMREQWALVSAEDRAVAESARQETLDFDGLLKHPAFADHDAAPRLDGYGPEALSELEAQALFAQPLLDGALDPEAIDSAMERASAYWEIAHQPSEERAISIRELARAFGINERERRRLEAEAYEMVTRFDRLFPEHAG